MDKKNNLLLTIIAIATLLVAVVGATFAYFASGVTPSNEVVNVRTASAAAFTSSIDNSFEIYASADNMAYENRQGTETSYTGSATANVTISLTGDPGSYCTYVVVYVPESDSSTYVPLSPKEGGVNATGGGLYISTGAVACEGSKTCDVDEIEPNYDSEVEFPNDATRNTFVVEDGIITVPAGVTTTGYTFPVTLTWKNLVNDQVVNAGKTFKGHLVVADIKCFDGSDDHNPLADGNDPLYTK